MARSRIHPTFRSVFALGAFILLGWALGTLIAGAFFPDRAAEGRAPMDVLPLVGGLLLVIFLVLAIHEIGHLLAGRLVGFRPLLLAVGPLWIERKVDRWRVTLNRTLALWGGVAASAPVDDRDLRRRTLIGVAGGPCASVLAGVAVLAPLGWLSSPTLGGGGDPPLLPTVLGAGSIVIGLVTLFPGRTSGLDTDGARILRLLRGGPAAEGEAALLALAARSMEGERPREWDPELLGRTLACPADSAMGLAAREMAYLHHLDLGRPQEAHRHLEAALERRGEVPTALRASLLGRAAHFHAVHLEDGARGRSFLAEAQGSATGSRHALLLGEIAVLMAEGQRPAAARHLERAREEIGTSVDRGTAAAEGAWLEELAEALWEGLSDPLAPEAGNSGDDAGDGRPRREGEHPLD